MAEDASLDDFASTDEHDDEADADGDTEPAASGADADTESGGSDADAESVAADPAAVEPATTTYGWASEPAACGNCGTAVERRWRDGDDLVCTECKEW